MDKQIHERLSDISGTPLYHHTSEERALSILQQNKLRGSLPNDDYLELDSRLKNTPHQAVVSFTRDKNFIPGISIGSSWESPKDLNVILVLDRDKLRTKYRIEPFNYFSLDPDFKELPYEKNEESEERVLTNYIYPLDKYLTKIIYKGNNPEFKKELENISKRNINELSPRSAGVEEFMSDVKETKGSLKALGFKNFKALQTYVDDATYDEFEELRQELKDFKNKDVIKEQQKMDKLPKLAIKIFKYVDELRAKNPNYKLKKQIEELISRTLEIMGMDAGLSRYYSELYFANKSKNKKYEDLGPEDIVDPRTLPGKTTTNPNAFKYTKSMLPFRGHNLSGHWETDNKGVDIYVVLSYRWYPIFLNKEGRWYEVVDKYSSSTSKQIYNSDPTQLKTRWDKDINVPVYLVTPKEMETLRRGATHQEIIEGKAKRLLGSREELQNKRAQFSKTWGSNQWPQIDDEVEVPTKIKFKIKDVVEKDGKVIIQVDIQDVKRRAGNIGVDTPQNYLKGELTGITKEKVEKAVKKDLIRNYKEYLGTRRSDYSDTDLKDSLIDFEFNHVKKV